MFFVITCVMQRNISLLEAVVIVKQIAIEWTVKSLAYSAVAGMLAAILIQSSGNH